MTAAQILAHCKAVCDGEIKSEAHVKEFARNEYIITRVDFGVFVSDKSDEKALGKAALLLGLSLDTKPAASAGVDVVLEWVERTIELTGNVVATTAFNSKIWAEIYYYLDGTASARVYTPDPFARNYTEMRGHTSNFDPKSWCLTTITELVTQKKHG